MLNSHMSFSRKLLWTLLALAVILTVGFGTAGPVTNAQQPANEIDEGGPSATTLPVDPAAAATPESPDTAAQTAPAPQKAPGINALSLLMQGGIFMWPIGLMSLLAVSFAIERGIALRRERILPKGLVAGLGNLGGGKGGFDPRQAYRLCQQFPSATATVIRAMLLKVGRPHSEVEHAVSETSEREAERLYSNVRWLTLAAAVAPLIGLLGTVQGMIIAFHTTTQLGPGVNKADALATGIYTALVTTFGGLCVAIPSAMIAHYFEGRIQKMFHQIDELLFSLLPQIERYEGRVRFSRQLGDGESSAAESPPAPKTAAVTPK